MTPPFPKKFRGHLRAANHAGAIGENQSRARLVPVKDPLHAVQEGILKRRWRAANDLLPDHLDGGGALSGGSRWSKAIAAPPANALPNMWPSPVTRLAATIWSANHFPRCVPRSS
jgi:hypothetical protein